MDCCACKFCHNFLITPNFKFVQKINKEDLDIPPPLAKEKDGGELKTQINWAEAWE